MASTDATVITRARATTEPDHVLVDELLAPDWPMLPAFDPHRRLASWDFTPGDEDAGRSGMPHGPHSGNPVLTATETGIEMSMDVGPVELGTSGVPIRSIEVTLTNLRDEPIGLDANRGHPNPAALLDVDAGRAWSYEPPRNGAGAPLTIVGPGESASVFAVTGQPFGATCEPDAENAPTPCAGPFDLHVLISVGLGPFDGTSDQRPEWVDVASDGVAIDLPEFFRPETDTCFDLPGEPVADDSEVTFELRRSSSDGARGRATVAVTNHGVERQQVVPLGGSLADATTGEPITNGGTGYHTPDHEHDVAAGATARFDVPIQQVSCATDEPVEPGDYDLVTRWRAGNDLIAVPLGTITID
ncbi:MAG: hypothetical protein S0880_25110 [Actinomycetota bacterium]|nr:hypothetical protein [Actinomycetota bacterium]